MTPRSSDFATAGWAYGPSEVAYAICALEAAGIRVLPHGFHHASVAWHHVIALGGVELRVPTAQAEIAREILSSADFSQSRSNAWLLFLAGLMLFLWIGPPLLPVGGLFIVRPTAAAAQKIQPEPH